MRKRLAIYGVITVLLLVYLGFLAYFSVRDGATEATFRQLEIGMGKSEVRGMLVSSPDERHHWVKGQVHEDWVGDDGTIMLAFDEQDQLIWKAWEERRRRPSLREKWDGMWVVVRE